jgi:hypothetical protein
VTRWMMRVDRRLRGRPVTGNFTGEAAAARLPRPFGVVTATDARGRRQRRLAIRRQRGLVTHVTATTSSDGDLVTCMV